MPETSNTGGLKKFVKSKESSKLDPEFGKKIDEAYQRADERKKRNKIIKISVIALILLLILISILIFI